MSELNGLNGAFLQGIAGCHGEEEGGWGSRGGEGRLWGGFMQDNQMWVGDF